MSVTSGGTIAIGKFVKASARVSTQYNDGQISIGVDIGAGLLVGININLDLQIDINPVIDIIRWLVYGPSYVLISNGMVSAVSLVEHGILDVTEAIAYELISVDYAIDNAMTNVTQLIAANLITAFQAVEQGFVYPFEAIMLGYITGFEAVQHGFVEPLQAVMAGYITALQAVVNFNISGHLLYINNLCTVGYLLENNILVLTDFSQEAEQLLHSGVFTIHDYMSSTGQDVANVATVSTRLVQNGVIDAATVTAQLGLDIGNAVNNAINDAINDAIDEIGGWFGL